MPCTVPRVAGRSAAQRRTLSYCRGVSQMTHKRDGRDPDPEQDPADLVEAEVDNEERCPNCGQLLDEDGDCVDPTCEDSPLFIGEVDDDEDEDDPNNRF